MTQVACVLLVDDSEADNFFHKMAIEESGLAAEIVAIDDPVEALDALREGRVTPSIIFLDINMPKMNGWELLDALQERPGSANGSDVVVMLSTSSDPRDIEQVEARDNVVAYLTKPLDSAGFVEIVETHLGG